MNLRDEIKAEFSLYMHDQQAEEAANAIIAKLRPAPLVWQDNTKQGFYCDTVYGVYGAFRMLGGSKYYATLNGVTLDKLHHKDVDAAKAAAEAHHIAAWRKAGGLDT